MRNGVIQCHVCGSNVNASPSLRTVSRAYDRHRSDLSSKYRFLNVLLVVSDCCLLGLQPILVYMSKVDGKFLFSPVSVNFLTEVAKVTFTVIMLINQARGQRRGERSLISFPVIFEAARVNYLLAVPALFYAINNYLKFTMQLYFNPATTKMLSNLKVLMIALLLKLIMRRHFTVMQWEALGLLLIGISVNQLRATPTGTTFGLPEAQIAYLYTLLFITVPSLASVFNEYALKSQFDTSIYLQNLFLYGYGAIFNFLGIVITMAFKDTILKKYSSTVATIFTGLASAALFGHTLTINFVLGVSIVFISMHQFFSSLTKPRDGQHQNYGLLDHQMNAVSKDSSLLDMTAAATEGVSHKINMRSEHEPLLPT